MTPTYTILLLLQARPEWLRLSRKERQQYFENTVTPLFESVAKQVQVRLFDSEYFHAKVSDFILLSTSDLTAYGLLIEKLRDSAIYQVPYFEVVDIIIGQEEAFKAFDKQLS